MNITRATDSGYKRHWDWRVRETRLGSGGESGKREWGGLFHFPWEAGSDRTEWQRYGYGQRFLMYWV